MYSSLFTEFSYGYALTDNIIHAGLPSTPAAPVFPSLIAEGSAGGGYDVQIPAGPVPLFLQFKIPQVVRRRSDNKPAAFVTPYLRMHLRTKRPNQHQLLLDLEAQGNLVVYATPDFWKTSDLDAHFVNQRVHLETCYFSPSDIGPLDHESHYVAYCPGMTDAWVFSNPTPFSGKFRPEAFGERISAAAKTAREQQPLQFFQRLKGILVEITGHELLPQAEAHMNQGIESSVVRAAREVAYLAQVRLGCTFAVAGWKDGKQPQPETPSKARPVRK
jgi:hypothetical protein